MKLNEIAFHKVQVEYDMTPMKCCLTLIKSIESGSNSIAKNITSAHLIHLEISAGT